MKSLMLTLVLAGLVSQQSLANTNLGQTVSCELFENFAGSSKKTSTKISALVKDDDGSPAFPAISFDKMTVWPLLDKNNNLQIAFYLNTDLVIKSISGYSNHVLIEDAEYALDCILK